MPTRMPRRKKTDVQESTERTNNKKKILKKKSHYRTVARKDLVHHTGTYLKQWHVY